MKTEYNDEEISFIRENFLIMSNEELAISLNRTKDGIAYKLKELGLRRKENIKPYTTEEKQFIASNIGKMTINEIAKKLERTQGGVSKYVSKFRVKNMRKKRKVYLENIENDVVPFFSKSDSYYEVLEKMKVGDSFEYPEKDTAIVNNQKYEVVNLWRLKGKDRLFSTRKTSEKDGEKMRRIWRLA